MSAPWSLALEPVEHRQGTLLAESPQMSFRCQGPQAGPRDLDRLRRQLSARVV